MTEPFDVNGLIREVVESGNLSDPGDITTEVAARIPDEALRTVLCLVLRDYVRIQLHSFETWRRPSPEPVAQRGPSSSRSAKVGAIRAWALVLRKPVAVEANVWKQFGECTSGDLAFLSEDRRQNAAASIAAAERFEKYAAALAERDAETVADLPDEVIASIEDGAR